METCLILLIILGAISGSCRADGVLPDRVVAAVGGTVTFNTTVTPPETPFLVVTWSFSGLGIITSTETANNTEPAYTDRVTLFRPTASLELRHLTPSDAGEYTVTIIQTGVAARKGNSLLVIYVPVSNVMVTPSSTDLVEFSSVVRLSCSSSGSSLSFLWMNGSSAVTATDRVQLTDGGSALTIVNVTRYDEGPFRCNVFNLVSNGTSDPIKLSISYGPENVNLTSPQQEYHVEGSNIVLSCSADSRPAAQFHWFMSGALLSGTGPELRLMNVQMSQSGNYSCQALNNKTLRYQTSRPSALTVLAPVSSVKVTPSSTDLVEFSSSVRLSCSSSGSSLSFLWMNGSSAVTATDRVQLTDGGSALTIVNVTRYDEGPFRCNVINPFSNGTSDPIKLSVSYGPENVNLTSPSQEYHVEGSDIVLSCSAGSRPAAQFHWFLSGALLSDTGPELRLMNVQMSQSGNYSCQALNNKTLRYQTSRPSALTVLAPVSNVKITPSSTDLVEFSSSVRLSCSSSGSSLSFLWMNGSSAVTATDRVQLTDGGSALTIVNVTRYDEGPFRCNVFNPVTNSSSDPMNLLIIYGPENINLTLSPSREHYDEGSDITLRCSADCRPAAQIHWFLNGSLMSDTGPELRLMYVQMSQSGNYSCQALNSRTMRNQTSEPAAVSVRKSQVSDVVVTPTTTDLSELRSSVSLSCSASGSFPSFLWMNGSSEVTASDDVQITDGGATLTIINVTRYDEGPFMCHAFNNFSNYTSDPVKLSISFGPENLNLKLSPSQEHYVEGSNIVLICSADSRPAAQFHWFLNGNRTSDSGPELRLMNIQMSRRGNYSCQAFNNKTLSYETSQLAAVSILAPVSSVVVTTNNTLLLEFSSVRLSCSSSGSSLSFLWMNGSSQVAETDRVRLTDGGSTLTIVSVTRYDEGPFSCIVSNGVSSEISPPVNLFIHYGPDKVAITGPKSTRVGDFIMLYCSTESAPPATLTWLFNGAPTSSHEAVYVIAAVRPSDGGTYTCTAVNTATGQNQSVSHEITVVDFSECNCSAAAGIVALTTAGCCFIIAAVAYCLIRRNRVNSNYPAHRQEKLSTKEKRSDVYKISRTAPRSLSSLNA